jgi:hypothetical protein
MMAIPHVERGDVRAFNSATPGIVLVGASNAEHGNREPLRLRNSSVL